VNCLKQNNQKRSTPSQERQKKLSSELLETKISNIKIASP